MAKMTIGKTAEQLKQLFNDVEEVYYSSKPITADYLAGGQIEALKELPVTEDGVNFNTGEAEVTNIKLTTGKIWCTKVKKGDADISFQLPSIDGEINDLFLEKVAGKAISALELGTLGSFSGEGYALTPKKVEGALVMPSADRATVIILPSVEMYATLNLGDGDNPAYFDVKVTPVANADSIEIYILGADAPSTQEAGE